MTGINDLQAVFGGVGSMENESVRGSAAVKDATSAGEAMGNQSATGTDRSVVSSAGDALLRAMSGSDVRMDKVASLQVAIMDGNYQVSSNDVASSLISAMLGKG